MTRAFDTVFSLVILVLALPFMLLVPIGIVLSNWGPVFYRSERVGKDGRVFLIWKFRSMRMSNQGAVITSANDSRVFAFGKLIRKVKLDELPQLFNILNGDMAVIGPRPEDPSIVNEHYTDWMLDTLSVRPGLTSLGSVFYYAFGESLVDDDDPEASYVNRLLPVKMAVERAHLSERSIANDLRVIGVTILAVVGAARGKAPNLSAIDFRSASQWASFNDVPGLQDASFET